MNTATLKGSVVDAPENIKRAIAADPAKAELWQKLQSKSFEELAWGVITNWRGVRL